MSSTSPPARATWARSPTRWAIWRQCHGGARLLDLARKHAPDAVIVYAGTRQVYGAPLRLPVGEDHPLHPPDPNAVAKMAGEAYHLLYHRLHGLRALSLRLTNVYGPRMRIKDARQGFLGIWVRQLLEGEPIEVWGGAAAPRPRLCR